MEHSQRFIIATSEAAPPVETDQHTSGRAPGPTGQIAIPFAGATLGTCPTQHARVAAASGTLDPHYLGRRTLSSARRTSMRWTLAVSSIACWSPLSTSGAEANNCPPT